jgi:hypothetical protein
VVVQVEDWGAAARAEVRAEAGAAARAAEAGAEIRAARAEDKTAGQP